jgi:hypothetical protein
VLPACRSAGQLDPGVKPRAQGDDLTVEAVPDPLYAGPFFSLAGDYVQLHFHLNLINRGRVPLHLRRVGVGALRGGQVLSRLDLEEPLLKLRLRAVPWVVIHDRQTIAAAHRWRGVLARAKGETQLAPGDGASLTHLLFIVRSTELPDVIRCAVVHDGGEVVREVPVRAYRQKTRLRLPVSGLWWVMAGSRFDEDHAGAVLNSQNFAYDLGVLGANLTTYEGDVRDNVSYFARGRDILAAADGEVVRVHDGVPENKPVGARPSWQEVLRQPEDLAGNFVVLRHAAAEYGAYLHLQPGITLRRGATVRAGEPVGRCGNSGNSLESHLHFQLQDAPDPLRANGLPARFSDFTVHLAHLRLYVPPERSMPLPTWLLVEAGRSPGALELQARER